MGLNSWVVNNEPNWAQVINMLILAFGHRLGSRLYTKDYKSICAVKISHLTIDNESPL